MNENTITLIVSVAGILSTLVIAIVGFYYTHKAQTSTFREQLYAKQIDLIVKLFHFHGRFKVFSTLIIENHFKEEAMDDMRVLLRDHSIAKEEAGALFPVELYEQLSAVGAAMSIFMDRNEGDIPLSMEDQLPFSAADVKFALLSRSMLGVDELSTGNIKLTSSITDFKRVQQLDQDYFDRYIRTRLQTYD